MGQTIQRGIELILVPVAGLAYKARDPVFVDFKHTISHPMTGIMTGIG